MLEPPFLLIFLVALLLVLVGSWRRRNSQSFQASLPKEGPPFEETPHQKLERLEQMVMKLLERNGKLEQMVMELLERNGRLEQMVMELSERNMKPETQYPTQVKGALSAPEPPAPIEKLEVPHAWEGSALSLKHSPLPEVTGKHMPLQQSFSRLVDPKAIAFKILDQIDPDGRRAPLARLPRLKDWLKENYPNVDAEPICSLDQDLWLLVVLTPDQKTGVVMPAVDSIIGPGEILKWFEGDQYDGTQALMRANVSVLAMAERDEATQTWQPRSKGMINLTKRGGGI